MKKQSVRVLAAVITLGLLAPLGQVSNAGAAETVTDPALDSETPAFASPAQAQHAAALAEAAATSDPSLQQALQEVEQARTALENAVNDDDQTAIETARQNLDQAEDAYVETLSEISGVLDSDIAAMRDSGLGWGEIAHELGVAPGLLGLGQTKGEQNHYAGSSPDQAADDIDPEEIAEATARNLESGWSQGHGTGIRSGVHEAGTGLISTTADDDNDRGHMAGAGGLGHGSGPDADRGDWGGGDDEGGHDADGGPGGHGGSDDGDDNGPGTAGSDGSPGGSDGHDNGSDSGHGGASVGSAGSGSSASGHGGGSDNDSDSDDNGHDNDSDNGGHGGGGGRR